ncbi:MAG TPA: hypothetical protein DHT43_03535, partial [Deltaproteobacteria bacterium]|nr:hypothetical protein [Deltaproteobacteria bacterium]
QSSGWLIAAADFIVRPIGFMKEGEQAMGWAVKVYDAIHSGETKIKIPVFEVHPRCYSAVMLPVARSDEYLITRFQEHKLRHELGETIEDAVEMCKKWIRINLWQDVHVIEESKLKTQT